MRRATFTAVVFLFAASCANIVHHDSVIDPVIVIVVLDVHLRDAVEPYADTAMSN